MNIDEAVWVDPERTSGAPCFRGSRVPVRQLFDWLADGVPLEEFLDDFQIDRGRAIQNTPAGEQRLVNTSAD